MEKIDRFDIYEALHQNKFGLISVTTIITQKTNITTMNVLNLKMLIPSALILVSGLLSSNFTFAQEGRSMDKVKMEAPGDNVSWNDYKQDLRTKYQHVMNQIDHMQKEYAAKTMNHPDFKKSLAKFESNVKKFGERMKNSDAIPDEKQARFRKKMKSELNKLNADYEKIRNRWEAMNKGNVKAGMPGDNQKMNWEEYRQDLRNKYQQVMSQADRIREEARSKQINAPDFKESVDQFEVRAKEFAERMKNADAIPNEKQDEFRQAMKNELNDLNNAYDRLKQRWENINK
ncbi:MAG: hypothetical protein ABIQ74_04440 [Chitinophagales bacterium]